MRPPAIFLFAGEGWKVLGRGYPGEEEEEDEGSCYSCRAFEGTHGGNSAEVLIFFIIVEGRVLLDEAVE